MTYIQPGLPLTLLLLVLAVFAVPRWRRFGRATVAVAAVFLFLWSWEPVAQISAWTLERWYPATNIPTGEAEAIVVLSAGVRDPLPTRPEALLDELSYQRTRFAAWLHRHWRPLPVLASGGPIGPKGRKVVVSEVMKDALAEAGVPADMIWTERASLSTYQNAVKSAELLRNKGISKIVLVTHGTHMPRAERCFRAQGLEVIPAPCWMKTVDTLSHWKSYVPNLGSLRSNEECLHEWVGLLWYWASGRF